MATRKPATPRDEKFERQDIELPQALAAIDAKDYGWYDNLTAEQQRKVAAYVLVQFASSVNSRNPDITAAHVLATNEMANLHLLNEYVSHHPKLQWLMLCASGLGMGKQYHNWLPQISAGVASLRDPAKRRDIAEYFKKIYPTLQDTEVDEIAEIYTANQNRQHQLAKIFPSMKRSDIETLATYVTDEDIKEYERDLGE